MASMVASTRGSSAGRKPTIGIIRFDASRSSVPNDWVKAPAVSLHPSRDDGLGDLVAGALSSRSTRSWRRCGRPGRWPGPARPSTSPSSRGSAAGSPRTSQMPWSGLAPAAAAASAQAPRNGGCPRRRSASWSGSRCGGAEQLAVDVELPLVPGAVADPHGPAVPPAGEVGSSRSVRSCSPPTPNMICSVRSRRTASRGRGGHEGEELVGLVRAGRDPQRLHGEAGVADPGVAVVPVALAADRLRAATWSAAATIAPVGWNVSALQHPAAVCTRSRHGPSYAWCSADQDRQAAMVPSSASASSSSVQTWAGVSSSVRRCKREPQRLARGQRRVRAGAGAGDHGQRAPGWSAPATPRRPGR